MEQFIYAIEKGDLTRALAFATTESSQDTSPELLKKQGEYAKELKIESSVIFHGFAKNVHESIVDAGMYVMSSNYEGISNGMLEALGMGLPVIATDCPIGGARMFINDGVNGLLIPTNNKEKMVSAILSLIEDECTAEKLGKKASAIREELKVEKITGMWRKLIESEKINYENNSEI